MRNRGGFNRRSGNTTSRNKAKTHWGAGAGARRSASSKTTGKSRASAPSKSK
jgi:hypothetical protein